ncbi:MAG: DUF5615 family PIN-like protein [Dehalococcoidia bacterium]
MKLLIDMNLSPTWTNVLEAAGWKAVHWSTIGDPRAPDRDILKWARTNEYIILTHDLEFGAILAATRADCPSVLQIRTQNVSPYHLQTLVISVLERFKEHLEKGALITVDEKKSRAHILPLND